MISRFLGSSAGLLLALLPVGRGHAQSPDSPSSPVTATALAAPAEYDAEHDSAAINAAETLGLSDAQRKAFYENVQDVAHVLLLKDPSAGRPAIDSALGLVTRETGKKMRFLRQARVLFSEMYARRASDSDRPRETEADLWRSPRNVSGLIELYRKNPNASDTELERAMAPSFRVPH